jgi:hypothetical protein
MEIKLRAWDNVNNRMFYFSDLAWEEEYNLLYFREDRLDVPVGDNLEWMLFTGGVDRTGQACYDKDIFLVQGKKYVVGWNEVSSGWWLYQEDRGAVFPFHKTLMESGEVVGNIYQTKAPPAEGKSVKEPEKMAAFYSLEQLKAMAREQGVSSIGTKMDIIKRLKQP